VAEEPLICAECGRKPREDENAEDRGCSVSARLLSSKYLDVPGSSCNGMWAGPRAQ